MTPAAIMILVLGFGPTLTLSSAPAFLAFAGQTGSTIATLQKSLDTPQIRQWAARNGEAAILRQPGIISER